MISAQQLGARLADARKQKKLTQAQVADTLGIARTTLVAIEKGERPASKVELFKLATVLETSLNDLLRETAVLSEVAPRFRSAFQARGPSELDVAVDRLKALAQRYVELERMHGLRRQVAPLEALTTYRLDRLTSDQLQAMDPRVDGEDAARSVRALFGLGDEPFRRMDERLEAEAGLRIFYLSELPASTSGILIWTDELGACVAINRAHPVGRRRWTLAHELGHFLRDREMGDVLDESTSLKSQVELFPEAFAKELLLPAAGVQKHFAERCRAGKFTPTDLHHLARTFGVSFQAMALRLEELRLLPRGTYDRIERSGGVRRVLDQARHAVSRAQAMFSPPKASVELGLPERFVWLAVSAYDRELLSEVELARVLGTDLATAREVHRQAQSLTLDDGRALHIDYGAPDLRAG